MPINNGLSERITSRPEAFGGKPIIQDLRFSVEIALILLAEGVEPKAILVDYPGLDHNEIRACAA